MYCGIVEAKYRVRELTGMTLDTTVFKAEEGAKQRYVEAIGGPRPLFNAPDCATKLGPDG